MTIRAFVMGHPIAHSRSPMLHGYWLKRYGIDGSYERLDVPPAELDAFFAGFRAAGWAGGNVTVPHKTAVIAHAGRLDAAAEAMGAVNTLWYEGETLVGGNTDALGFLGNLDERAPGWDAKPGRAALLGAGGAARAAIYGLRQRGFTVAVFNRTPAKAEALATRFGPGVSAHGIDELAAQLSATDLLVNATSLGMTGQPPNTLDLAPLPAHAVVHDVVYAPLETGLLRAAAARGLRTVDGLGMLLHQAVAGFRHWFGKTPEVTAELRAILEADIRAKTPSA
jgi:shikimate dehydrogenase